MGPEKGSVVGPEKGSVVVGPEKGVLWPGEGQCGGP